VLQRVTIPSVTVNVRTQCSSWPPRCRFFHGDWEGLTDVIDSNAKYSRVISSSSVVMRHFIAGICIQEHFVLIAYDIRYVGFICHMPPFSTRHPTCDFVWRIKGRLLEALSYQRINYSCALMLSGHSGVNYHGKKSGECVWVRCLRVCWEKFS